MLTPHRNAWRTRAAVDLGGESVEASKHLQHHLVSSSSNRRQTVVTEESSSPRFLDVTHATVVLQAGIGNLADETTSGQFCNRRLPGGVDAR